MSDYGLRVWNSAGNLIVDFNNRLPRFVGNYTFSVYYNNPVSIAVPGLLTNGTYKVIRTNVPSRCSLSISAGYVTVTLVNQDVYGNPATGSFQVLTM